jgi:ataxia telangiectasia mutated family protein
VGQAWQRASDSKMLVDYILLFENDHKFIRMVPESGSLPDRHTSQARPSTTASRSTIEFCYRETTTVIEKWQQVMTERAKSVTPVGIRLVACLCMISDKVAAYANVRTAIDAERLRILTTTLVESVTVFLASKECDQAKIDALYDSVADSLPDLALLNAMDVPNTTDPQGLSFLLQLSNGLQNRFKSQEKYRLGEMTDLMDLDNAFDSQASNGQSKPENKDGPRDDVSLTDTTSFQSCISQYLVLLSCQVEAVEVHGSVGYVQSSFIDHLIGLASEDFCVIKPLLTLLWSSPLIMSSSSIDSIVEYVAENFLEDYRFDRHEIALNICIDLLAHHASQWTDPEAKSLNEAAGQIYQWFVTVALPNNLCSLSVRQRLADLFFDLLKVKGPGYTGPDDDQSIRTYIFTLFKSRELQVTHKVAQNIPNFFNCFVLGEHEAVFNDLYKNLPDKTDWMEGLAMRLLVLAELGSPWQTLRRRCIYHIFETAGMVKSSSDHARCCMSKIAAAVQLPSSTNLFRLFASQLLFTWLGVQTISTIPFGIFNYASLDELIRDVQDEAFPQAIMRAKETDIAFLTKTLKSSSEEILKSTFAKSTAYCLAWDVDKGSTDDQVASSEARVIGLLGRKKYHELLPTHMPYILGVFFTTIEQEEQVGKLLTRRTSTQAASAVLGQILGISSSNYSLPFDQQPTFLAKNLIDRIGRLWRRLGHNDISKMWTPSVYVFVLRVLLSKIHPALGSLHACSMIRKLRILVSLAGSVALSGYAIEMALHALLPFTTDKQCADDSLGIVQYLLQQGTQSLASNIHSVAGLVISAFVSLRKFVGSSQDSTTQESQHLATMEKAQRFHTWLSKQWLPAFAEAVQKQGYDERLLKRFSAMMHAASEARAEANAIDGTTESKLLLDLLQDQSSGGQLLKGSILDIIFRSFCSQFKPSPSFRSDILGQDSHAEDLAASVWHSSCVHGVDEQYRMWAARVIGRAYNASGATHLLQTPHSGRILSGEDDDNENDDPAWTSKSIIFEVLEDMLRSSNSREVGLVEDSIRWMLSRMGGDPTEIQGLLASSVISALTLSTTDLIEHAPPLRPVSLEDAFSSQKQRSVDTWLQVICISLANKAFADPIIASLTRAIHGIPTIAERLFAPILHIVLLREYESKQDTRKIVSSTLKSLFHNIDSFTVPHAKAALKAIMYLRKQPLPKETTPADRERWLELDYVEAARAADYCKLHTTALLLAELGSTQTQTQRNSRRSIVLLQPTVPDDLLLSIYKSIEEPDSFYGVNQEASLSSVLSRLDYEAKGFKSLLFRSAQADSEMRRLRNISEITAGGLVSALNYLNLNSLNHALLSSEQFKAAGPNTAERALEAARKLEQWDIRVPEPASTETSIVYAVLQGISNATDMGEVCRQVNRGFTDALAMMVAKDTSPELIRSCSRTLGTLTEIDDIMTSLSLENLEDAYTNMKQREKWMLSAQ